MLGIQSRISRVKKADYLLPVLPLIPLKLPSVEEDKGKYIAFELKTRVGTTFGRYQVREICPYV